MSDGMRILDLYARRRADVARMVVTRAGPRGTVIVHPECSADELQAVADRPFEPGSQVLVASAQGVASTFRALGQLPAGLSGATAVTATRRSPLVSTPVLAESCPSFVAVPIWAILGSASQIGLWSYSGGTPIEAAWAVDLEGDWGPILSAPWPLDVRRNGDVAMRQPTSGGELAVATIIEGAISRWDMALDSGATSISRPVWHGDQVAVAIRTTAGARLYRWDGRTHVSGVAPEMSWMPGPSGLPSSLPGIEIAVGPSGQVLYSEGGNLWQRIGSTWRPLPGISGTSDDLMVLDYRTALAGPWRIDLQAGTVALWQEWSDSVGADIPLMYASSGGVVGYPYRVDAGDSLISCALPPTGKRWGGSCPAPVVSMTVPSGWNVAAVGAK